MVLGRYSMDFAASFEDFTQCSVDSGGRIVGLGKFCGVELDFVGLGVVPPHECCGYHHYHR